ncbi:MAG TPA: PH domain-containing protein [Micromonosporaceae bacterium]
MGFPENELTSNERVVMQIHPHWKALVGPIALLVVVVAGLVWAWVASLNTVLLLILAVIGLALVVWLTLIPYMKWHSTHYVFTNERVITRVGIFSRDLESIPLNRVNDVSSHQSFFDRLLGAGSLTIESAGDHGQDTFKQIPHVSRVTRQLHELIDPETNTAVPTQATSNDGNTKNLARD